MKKTNLTIEHEACIESLPKIDRQLHPLIRLETATKKRRAQKKKAARRSCDGSSLMPWDRR